jgi:hypothetical protein
MGASKFNIPPTRLCRPQWIELVLALRGGNSRCEHHAGVIVSRMTLVPRRDCLEGVISPSVMVGVERGNLDLLILAVVGLATSIYEERKLGRTCGAIARIRARECIYPGAARLNYGHSNCIVSKINGL